MLAFSSLRACAQRAAPRGTRTPAALSVAARWCSTNAPKAGGSVAPTKKDAAINSVTLVGVAHDIQSGYVFEDAVTQFTLTTTSLDTTNPTHECVVEKDHHTVRCFGDVYSQEIKAKVTEGSVVCVNGRLRLNPQLEPSCNKYYYFPFIHVQPPHGQVSVVYGDRRAPPQPTNASEEEIQNAKPGASVPK